MAQNVRIGIIGAGRWGTNYLRTFDELENAEVRWLCSTRQSTIEKALSVAEPNHEIKTTTNYQDILNDEEVDAVAIASIGSTHYEIAKAALNAEKHVLVEKPLSFNSREAEKLVAISKQKRRILMVGHIHRYNPGIQKIKSDIDKGLFGKISYVHFLHFGNGPVRNDMNAIWDFFPHSVSILYYILDKSPLSVSANGVSYINKGIEDVAVMSLKFPDNVSAGSIASWLYPLKKMQVVIFGEKIYAVFDDYAGKEKLKYYYAGGKYASPKIGNSKPLSEELKHFLHCIQNNKTPVTDGNEGLKIVYVLEAAQKSLKNNGKFFNVSSSS